MLVLTRKPDQRVIITVGDKEITLSVLSIRRGVVRIGIDAPSDVIIHREEVALKIKSK